MGCSSLEDFKCSQRIPHSNTHASPSLPLASGTLRLVQGSMSHTLDACPIPVEQLVRNLCALARSHICIAPALFIWTVFSRTVGDASCRSGGLRRPCHYITVNESLNEA